MKHMKKNDGYVMVYVMIVFTILSFVAVSICGMAVKNLQAQKATINRMTARYEAEAVLQQFIAEVESESFEANGSSDSGIDMAKSAAIDTIKSSIVSYVNGKTQENKLGIEANLESDGTINVAVDAIAENETSLVTIKATMIIDVDFSNAIDPVEDAENGQFTCKVQVEKLVWNYISYDISYEQKGGAG